MATLFHPQNFFSYLSPHHNNISAFRNPFLAHQHSPPRPRQHFTICCSTIRKSRASRKVMSDGDLCNELKEFISLFGFEDGHVPSMKELSHHGRKDLAHIVRRRGYKLIGELLGNSREIDSEELDVQRNLIERRSATVDCENGITGQDEKVENSDEILSSLVTDSNGGSMNVEPVIKASEQSSTYGDVESPALTDLTLQEKVEKFIQNGELDMLEDESGPDIFKVNLKLDNNVLDPEILDEEHLDYVSERINDAVSSEQSTPAMKSNSLRDERLSTEPPSSAADCENDLDVENDERENQAEINHLKLMLHQKEGELSQLKEQIEKEKFSLSALQVKAESAIRKAQKLVSEKDEELQAAEESLLGLKEVQIQYLADGEVVEVAGSFNGWHHRVKLDAQPDSGIVEPIGSRKSRFWSTILWLYPGEYEIKFVVDGEWKTDPHRELITWGTVHNNILRVDR